MTRRGGWLDFLHGAVTRNVGLKLSSIFIAVVLFSVVHGAEDLRRNVFVGVVAVPPGDAKDLMLVSEIPDRIRLTLSGTRAQLNSINPNDLAPVELKVHDPSQEHYYFSPSDFDLPAGVAITQIAPTSVDLRWVKRAQVDVPVNLRTIGKPPKGLLLSADPVIAPDRVVVTGPKDTLADLHDVDTQAVDLSDLQPGSNAWTVRLASLPPFAEYRDTSTVEVRMHATQDVEERKLSRLEILATGGEVRKIRPRRVNVVLRGPPDRLNGLDPDQIVPMVDVSAVDPGQGAAELPVRLRGVPQGIDVASVTPAQVVVIKAPFARKP